MGLKVDIDTYEGAKEGIPRLIKLFKRHSIPASFFAVMGPEHSGRAVFRLFTHKGFLKKMLRTKAPKAYGLKTLLYGTLLPGPMMSEKLKHHYRMIISEGFELGVHGYDHIAWHNDLTKWSEEKIRGEYDKIREAYRKIAGKDPESLGTPGWQESADHLKVTDSLGFSYRSDTRFSQPFYPEKDGYASSVPEIPTTFPSLDEVLGNEDVLKGKGPFDVMMQRLQEGKINIFTLHTELEGRFYLRFFEEFILKLKEKKGMEFLTLQAIADRVRENDDIPRRSFHMGEVPGRAGKVAIGGEVSA
ncbi:MAG: polysaccharide deacetylase family protein [Candidatus Aureabacteria bacterium]|nr:polysaccharide deacetylase family protein [Candidatus Auribacterota bacterium]